MKVLNSFFVFVYSLVSVWSMWLSINWLVKQGAFYSMHKFIFLTPYIFALFLALLFSIFLHFRLRTRASVPAHKLFLNVTLLNFIIFIWTAYIFINECGDCTGIFAPVFLVMILWSISLVSGIIALRKTATN